MVETLSWREVNASIASMTEKQVLALIEEELKGPKRTTVLVRLHQRYTMLRASREREEMLRKLKKGARR